MKLRNIYFATIILGVLSMIAYSATAADITAEATPTTGGAVAVTNRTTDTSTAFGSDVTLSGVSDNDTVRLLADPNTGYTVQWYNATGGVVNTINDNHTFTSDGSSEYFYAEFTFSSNDTDGDGMPDDWEIANGTDPEVADGNEDPDKDGLTNLQEYRGYNGFGSTRPLIADTDGDGMRDGWEAYWGLDPNDATGDNGAAGNPDVDAEGRFPDGDRLWNVETGLPAELFTNMREYRRFVDLNGSEDLEPNTFLAAMENSTDPLDWDTDGDGLPDGWEVSYGLNPTDANGDNGANGNPDRDASPDQADGEEEAAADGQTGDMLYGGEGVPTTPYRNIDEYNRWAQSDFNSGTINELGSTDPTNPDTDGDGMPDGWEQSYGGIDTDGDGILDDWNPDPLVADADGNPDEDFKYVEATGNCMGGDEKPFTNIQEFQISSQSLRGATTHPRNNDVDEDRLPDHWEVIYSYDPWNSDTDGNGTPDGAENPDGDFMADDGAGNIHNAVYIAEGFDPRTGYAAGYANIWQWLSYPKVSVPAPNTRPFTNVDEILGDSGSTDTLSCTGRSTNPRSNDTDGDGIHDGWEYYVGLDPLSGDDGGQDWDLDGLSNVQEFQCNALKNLGNAGWLNKIWPTDPSNPDTDGDQISDGGEMTFIYESDTGWNGYCYEGGGLNPCTVDTDGDHIPDGWEVTYMGTGLPATRNGMDGTYRDSTSEMTEDHNDYDGDGLENYQEYWAGAVYHWQETSDPLIDGEWFPGGGYSDYDPLDLFTGQPFEFDWHYFSDMVIGRRNQPDNFGFGVPYFFLEAIPHPTGLWWSTTDPLDWDTDGDSMDDYYEAYHGLNPLFGVYDIYASKYYGILMPAALPPTPDVRMYPYIAGSEFLDLDQDGLPNGDESLQPEKLSAPYYYHTDPSPMWMTDISYQRSFPNLYYSLISMADMWYFSFDGWGLPPDYVYSYESNEGFDTDNDNISDRNEMVDGQSPGATDPLTFESPIKRRALYLDGEAAARTFMPFSYGETPLENYTVETWVRPENAASGAYQVILERPIQIPSGNTMNLTPGIRVNFRIGLTPKGRPYVEYNGNGYDAIFVTAQAQTYVLPNEEWVHLAGVYDGEAGELRLYANGNLVGTTPSLERPANGYYQHNRIFAGPLVVGARENNPNGQVNGTFIVTNPFINFDQPDLDRYFQGWVDEIRIWNGVRTQLQLQENMRERMRMSDIMNPDSANAYIMFLYTFDSLPDPDHSPVSPPGFDALTGRPNDGTYPGITWWRTANDRSTVYDDYLYLPWIENVDTHVPVDPAYDSVYWAGGTQNAVTNITEEVEEVEQEDADGNIQIVEVTTLSTNVTFEVNPAFKNSSNPYNFGYYTAVNGAAQAHPMLGGIGEYGSMPIFDDMLPLRGAAGDEDVELWDEGGSGRDPYDTDGDGLPDYWEEMFGLDPLDATGENGRWGDPDMDGLDNYAEYLAGTFPQNSDSNQDGLLDYDTTNSMGLTYGQLYDDGDGMPNEWEESWNDPDIDPALYDADLDADGDGWSNYAEYRGDTDPTDPSSYPTPTISGTIYYDGDLDVGATEVILWFYQNPEMDGVPLEARLPYQGEVTEFSVLAEVFEGDGGGEGDGEGDVGDARIGKLVEGDMYVLAFLDVDGVDGYSAGDPMAVMQNQPVSLSAADVDGLKFQMTDTKPGFWRYSWQPVAGVDQYYVAISKISGGSTAPVFQRVFSSNRTFIHEADFHYLGLDDGLTDGSWRVAVMESDAAAEIYYDDTTTIAHELLNAPLIRKPKGATVTASQVATAWTADDVYAGFDIEVIQNGSVILSETIRTPYKLNGIYQHELPWFTGDHLPDGEYVWHVRGRTAYGVSDWASSGRFVVDLDNDNSNNSQISGMISYVGKVTNGVFVVQVAEDELFSGPVVAQLATPNTSASGVRYEAPFTVKGLREGTYYVRGFIDQDGNRKLDKFESRGMVVSNANIYHPKEFITPPDYANQTLVVRDVDYDNDRVADAWEIQNFGDITLYSGQDEHPDHPGFTVFEVFEMNHYYPWADSDADGISDFHAYFVYGVAPYDSLALDKNILARHDYDRDGVNDAVELALGSNPYDPEDRPLNNRIFQIERIYIEAGLLKVDYCLADGVVLGRNITSQVLMNDSLLGWSDAVASQSPMGHEVGDGAKMFGVSIEIDGDPKLESKKFFRIDWKFNP